jgi:hypothetical protein
MAQQPDDQMNRYAGGGAGTPHATADPSTPPPYPEGTSAEAIRQDIARTRAEMDHTVEALQERLRPRHLLDDVLEWFRTPSRGATSGGGGGGGGGGNASSAVETAKDLGQKVVDKLKQHPIPAALIGGGLTWLLFEGDSRDGGGRTRNDYTPRKWDVPGYSGSYVDARTGEPYAADYGDEARRGRQFTAGGTSTGAAADYPPGTAGQSQHDEGPGMLDKAKQALGGAADSVRGTASSAAGAVSDWAGSARGAASDAGRTAREYASGASEQFQRGYQTGRHYLERGIDDYPLAMGAAAMALGVLSGLLLPNTRTEDRLMGEQADEVKQRAMDAGEDVLERGKQVAAAATSAATDEASRQGAHPGSLADKVRHVVQDVAHAAGESARREGIDPASLAQKGRDVADRAKEAAKDEARRQGEPR